MEHQEIRLEDGKLIVKGKGVKNLRNCRIVEDIDGSVLKCQISNEETD